MSRADAGARGRGAPARLALLLLLGACGGDEGVLQIGTGEASFEALEDGQEVPLVFGPQGGHHVWISLRASGLQGTRMEMDLDLAPLDTSEPPPRSEPVRVLMSQGELAGELEYVGWPAILPDASCYVGVPLSVRVTLTDEKGTVATDEAVLVPAQGAPGLEPCPR